VNELVTSFTRQYQQHRLAAVSQYGYAHLVTDGLTQGQQKVSVKIDEFISRPKSPDLASYDRHEAIARRDHATVQIFLFAQENLLRRLKTFFAVDVLGHE
jgi:hypothetical protein